MTGTAGDDAALSRRAADRRRLLIAGGVLGLTAIAGGVASRFRGQQPIEEDGAASWPATALTMPNTVRSAAAARENDAVQASSRQTATAPSFSDVARIEPVEALRFLSGRHPSFPGANLDSSMGFSPADILETCDTDVLDTVRVTGGNRALDEIYRLIATRILEAMLAVYGDAPVVLALDAGHGGNPRVYYDPGSNGTEEWHTRAVVEQIEALATRPRYASLTLRRIFNDAIGDEFGMPPPEDRTSAASLSMRNIRGAILAYEAAAWNAAHPNNPWQVHVISVHFNAGSYGSLVLHQSEDVPAPFVERSIAFAEAYVDPVRRALNDTGLLPYRLGLALGNGLSDDRVLYDPPSSGNLSRNPVNPYTGTLRTGFPRRYAMLQASLLQRDYLHGALIFNGLG